MKLDIPFWTWVLARRIPVFALVATLVCVIGGGMISRHSQNYISIAELVIKPDSQTNRIIDTKTHFEFLKFRALASAEVSSVLSKLNLEEAPLSRINVQLDASSEKIRIGIHDENPETAHMITTALTRGFQSAAGTLAQQDAKRRVNFFTSEVATLRLEMARSVATQPQHHVTEGLYQTSLDSLAKAKADLQMPPTQIISVLSAPTLADTPIGPKKASMYMALVSFAVFCGLIVILVLEWLDTVIRRPRDIEHILGIATFGVIPDLDLQPIVPSQHSKGGL